MKAMILAAGPGTRLRPLTENISKCMVVIEGKPILEHNIDWLVRNQVTDIMINLNYLPETITRYFGDGSKWGARLTYSLEDEVLGTAGGVKKVSWFFDGPFIVWYGDNLSRCRLDALRKFHITKQGLVTMAVSYRPDVSQSG